MTLKFSPASHRYWLDGKPIPGVTSLLGDGLPKPALVRWAAKSVAEFVADNTEHMRDAYDWMDRAQLVAMLKQTPWSERDKAAVRGTDVHDLAERLAHGEEVEVPEHLSAYVNGYVAWLDHWRPEVIWTERPVANRQWWFAGKPDAVVRMTGQTWLLDWKTAKGVYGDNALQVASYANAEFSLTPDGKEEPMPRIDRLGVVHVTPTGTSLYEVADPAAAWKDAQHVMWVARAKDRIENYLGEPLDSPTETLGETA